MPLSLRRRVCGCWQCDRLTHAFTEGTAVYGLGDSRPTGLRTGFAEHYILALFAGDLPAPIS